MKRVNDNVRRQQYEQASLLLPWYITGKLDQAESEKVNAILEISPELQDELAHQLEISEMIKDDPEVLDLTAISSQDRRLESLLERFDEDSSDLSVSKSFLQKLSERLNSIRSLFLSQGSWLSNHRWQAAFSLFVVAQVAILAIVMNKTDNSIPSGTEYELAGTPNNYVASNLPVLTFQFTKQADKEIVHNLFKEIDAKIIEHSEGSSNYKVVLKSARNEQEIESLIRDLEKQNDLILLIGRGLY